MTSSRVLVVHVQRTGGTSLRRMIERSQGSRAVFPSAAHLRARENGRYVTPRELLDNWADLPEHRFLFGHCVASFADLLPVRYERAAFLREPVERSVSITQLHAAATGRPVSDLMHDAEFLTTHIRDLQTRVFGTDPEHGDLRPQDAPRATDATLETAITRLRTIEFIGTTDTYVPSLRRFDVTFATRLSRSVMHENRSRSGDVARSDLIEVLTPLVERDRVLFDVAKRLVNQA